MTDFEKDVIDRLGRIETKLDTDYKTLYGNGHAGLVDRVNDAEDRIRDLEKYKEAKQKHWGAIATVVAFIVNAAVAAYAAMKK